MNPPSSVPIEVTRKVRDTCLCLHTQRAARALARRFDEALKPVGLTNAQFSLLNALNGPAPVGMGRVAMLVGADRTTVTAALKPLVRRGLAAASPDPNDRRARRVGLTDAGRSILGAALPLWTAAHGALETELAQTNAERLREDLLSLSRPPAPNLPRRPRTTGPMDGPPEQGRKT